MGLKTVDAIFFGYVETSYAYRFLVIRSDVSSIDVNTIVEFRDATFFENVIPMKTGVPQSVSFVYSTPTTGSIPDYVERMTHVGGELDGVISRPDQSVEITEPRRSKRARISKDLGSDFITFNMEDDSVTFKQAMASSEAKF